jgi:hypothetical protein
MKVKQAKTWLVGPLISSSIKCVCKWWKSEIWVSYFHKWNSCHTSFWSLTQPHRVAVFYKLQLLHENFFLLFELVCPCIWKNNSKVLNVSKSFCDLAGFYYYPASWLSDFKILIEILRQILSWHLKCNQGEIILLLLSWKWVTKSVS